MSSTTFAMWAAGMLTLALVCAFAACAIARSRGLKPVSFFFLGLGLGVFGVIVAASVTPDRSNPPGWYPDPWAGGMLRWHDGFRWTGYQHPAT